MILDERLANLQRRREFQAGLLRRVLVKPAQVVCWKHYREHVRYHVRDLVRKIRELDAQILRIKHNNVRTFVRRLRDVHGFEYVNTKAMLSELEY